MQTNFPMPMKADLAVYNDKYADKSCVTVKAGSYNYSLLSLKKLTVTLKSNHRPRSSWEPNVKHYLTNGFVLP